MLYIGGVWRYAWLGVDGIVYYERLASDASAHLDGSTWVTQAGGAAWLSDTGLALDDDGFVRVNETLQSETDPLIFAAGDCASMRAHKLEKAGVTPLKTAKVRELMPIEQSERLGLYGEALPPGLILGSDA